jgi:hypothetical protein
MADFVLDSLETPRRLLISILNYYYEAFLLKHNTMYWF